LIRAPEIQCALTNLIFCCR
jgi:transcriptional regulator with XRE-family HTH domain